MKKEKTYTEKEYYDHWKKGYDQGMKNAIYENNAALKIGSAILDVLDTRYEFKKEDY